MLKLSKGLGMIGHPTTIHYLGGSKHGCPQRRRWRYNLLRSVAWGGLVAAGIWMPMAGPIPSAQATAASPAVARTSSAFRDAVNAAMKAAQLTQTAKTARDWQAIVQSWEQAIGHMKNVPIGDKNYGIAQRKAVEYGNNLNYARLALANQRQAASSSPSTGSQATRPKANGTQANGVKANAAKGQQTLVMQTTATNPLPALFQVPLKSLQTNPWPVRGAIVLVGAAGLVGLLTLEPKPARARQASRQDRHRDRETSFFTNLGGGVSGILAQLGNIPLQPSPVPLKSDKVQRKLFRKLVMLTKDEATAVRLIKGYLQRHPEHSMDWCCEKAIMDLQRGA